MSKTFLTEFIEIYKSYPCLWKSKSTDYKNRYKKDAAYTALVKKLQEIEPTATKKSVCAKINSLRSNFQSGAGADEIYETHLWYYDLLLFTKDQEMARESVNNLAENQEDSSESEHEAIEDGEKTQATEELTNDETSLISPPTRPTAHSSATSDCDQGRSSAPLIISKSATKKKRKSRSEEQADEILTMVGERLRNNVTANKNDAFDIFGKHVAAKLRTLPHPTKIYTEKLITDLLFEAELGNIDRNTKIATSPNNPTSTYYNHSLQQLQPTGYFCQQSNSATPQGSHSGETIFWKLSSDRR